MNIENADAVTLILSAATSFNGFDKSPGEEGKNPADEAVSHIEKAEEKSYEELLNNHIKDYQALFDKVELNLGEDKPEKNSLPTNERLAAFANDDSDNGMVALYYQYGRYLMIASSRAGGNCYEPAGIMEPPCTTALGMQLYNKYQYRNELLAC